MMKVIIFLLIYKCKCTDEESEMMFDVTVLGRQEQLSQEEALIMLHREVERFHQDMEQMEEDRMALWNCIDTRTRLCPCISNV